MGNLNLTLPIKYFIRFLFILNTENRVFVGPSVKNMSQPIAFSPNCNHNVGCILNLIGHALGISYTHSRPDRNNYIKIIYEDIGQMDRYIFQKMPNQNDLTCGISYDYGSLMHEKKMCRKHHNEKIFETKLSPYYIYMLGQRYALIFNDVKLLNCYYCSNICKNKKLKCYSNGYGSPNNCNEFRCPNSYSGRTCKEVPKISKNCGKIKSAVSRKSKTIKRKGKKTCTYHIGAKQK
uniref:Metalloendopeptidase n=1 Tax=Strongyloides papillosus TaxID=174720 RepID=A0A0N5C8R9_STREA